MNVPFNQDDLKRGAWYLALYNEVFTNGQRDIGNGQTVEVLDRNRFYTAIGYNLQIQGGYMYHHSDSTEKGQLQLSLHQNF